MSCRMRSAQNDMSLNPRSDHTRMVYEKKLSTNSHEYTRKKLHEDSSSLFVLFRVISWIKSSLLPGCGVFRFRCGALLPGKTHHKGTEKHKADIEEILCSVPLPLIVIVLLALCCLLPVKVTAQTAQPTLSSVSPVGAQRGKTVTLTIEGINLAGADHIFFSHPGLEGKIITIKNEGQEKREQPKGSTAPPIVDIAIKYRLTAEVKIAPDTPTGRHTFRLRTSMGTSNAGTIAVGNLPDVAEAEPNSEISTAQKVSLPATASGIINTSGDQDFYAFEARAGQELAIEVVASMLQSQLDSSLALLDAKGRIMTCNEDFSG